MYSSSLTSHSREEDILHLKKLIRKVIQTTPGLPQLHQPSMLGNHQLFIPLLLLLLLLLQSSAVPVLAFTSPRTSSREFAFASNNSKLSSVVTVNAAELDKSLGLTSEERTVVNVHRVCSPSVVYVTSVLLSPPGQRRQRRDGGKSEDVDEKEMQTKLPRGTSLGSGSGFTIDSAGYILTNYHVIQRAYEANQAIARYKTFWSSLARNATKQVQDSRLPINFNSELKKNVESAINATVSGISGVDITNDSSSRIGLPAHVFVRFGTTSDSSNGQALYHQCEIVDVVKELDIAVLKMCNPLPSMKPLPFGFSSDLLVGQSLLAIGNPFGLDRTITSGLVSALGRSVTGVAGNEIKNCIQTDCAINPGNSGGPLLTLKGEVVGVNTMIITTSGSSAGIGFAVPSDNVKDCSDRIVELDKERQLRQLQRKGRGWLGIEVATSSSLESSLRLLLPGSLRRNNTNETIPGAFVTAIIPDSPIAKSMDGGSTISITSTTSGSIHLGDRIINVGGCNIANGQEFVSEMKRRVEGERLTLTTENAEGEKKMVYVTLGKFPL